MEPKLTWFELMICPFTFRLAVTPGYSLLFGYKDENSEQRHTTVLRYKEQKARIESILESLHWLVQVNGILSLPQNRAQDAFQAKSMNNPPSLHLRIAYSDQSSWASVYAMDQVPPQVQALLDQCDYLGRHEIEDANTEGTTYSAEEEPGAPTDWTAPHTNPQS